MGALAIVMFAGITALAWSPTCTWPRTQPADRAAGRAGAEDGAQPDRARRRSARGRAFYLLQAFTAAILVLAANTAYNGFPVLASLLGRDGYLPRQLARRGDRLVFSNGIVAARRARRRC